MTVNLVVHDAANAVAFMKAMAAQATVSFGVYVYQTSQTRTQENTVVMPLFQIGSSHAQIMEVHHRLDAGEDHAPFHAVLKLKQGSFNIGLQDATGKTSKPEDSGLTFGNNNV